LNQKIFLGALAFAACGIAHAAVAETTSTTANDAASDPLNEVVIVANRAPEPLSKVGSSVTVLDDTTIRESQATLVADLLATTPGLTFARAGGVGQPTSVFIRGADSDQTVVLIDGVQLNDPSTTGGGFDFQDLAMGDISRIEILRGAQSTLYGSQAIGGVINIVTAEPRNAFGGGLQVEGGSLGTGSGAANIGGRSDSLQWRLAGNWLGTSGISAFDERDGGVERDSSQIGGGSGMLRYAITPELAFDLRGYYANAFDNFDGYDTKSGSFGDDPEYGRTSQALGYAGLTLTSPERTLTNRVAFQYTDSRTREYDPNAPQSYGSPSTETFYGIGRNEREEYQGIWEIIPRLQAVFGAQHERSTIDTDTPAFDYSGPVPLDNAATIDSGYLQLQGEVANGLNVTAGERYDHHDVYGGHSTGALAVAWALNDGQTVLRSSFSQGFKAPSLYELYSDYGNTALRPEVAHSWDAGIEQQAADGRAVLSATFFQTRSRDLIEFVDCPTRDAAALCPNYYFFGGYYDNVARTAAHGLELQASVRPSQALLLSANYTVTDTEDLSPGSATYGKELARRPKDTANASVTYAWPARWKTTLALRYGGRDFDDAANTTALGGYVLVDARASYSVSDSLELYARVDNVTGRYYETAYEYGSLPRQAFAGVRARF
jgi:vitamin B12 transporter